MEPTTFPEQTTVWAKNQKEDYKPLPAYSDETQTVTCWKLTWYERIKILFTGKMWFQQMNFGQKLQPQYMTVDKPFVKNG